MIRKLAFALLTITLAISASPQKASSQNALAQRTLDIYFIDVEGGQSTLFVTPDHQSLLIDAGWPDNNNRDADRIVAAMKLAGITRLDTVIITHYHDDHVGGIPQLAAMVPVGTFVDHGPLFERCPKCVDGFNAYMSLLAKGTSKRRSVTPGDTLPFHDISVRVVSANGQVIPQPAGATPNRFCADSEIRPTDLTENGKSVGVVIRFGKFQTSDLGDLTWDMERKLMCPANPVGTDSLLIVSHHGWSQSSSPAYVAAVHPRAAIMDNGATKGGSIATFKTLEAIPGMDLWQLHSSDEVTAANTTATPNGPAGVYAPAASSDRAVNAPAAHIANLTGNAASDRAFYLKVSARADGSFTIFNARTGDTTNYPAR
jgi:competence protein ComEC